MKVTTIMREEHELILRMLKAGQAVIARIQRGENVPTEDMSAFVDFIQQFADHYHHEKEEHIFFERLAKWGMPKVGSPIDCMVHEHEFLRNQTRAMSRAIESKDAKSFAGEFESYIYTLFNHIHKENEILFNMAEDMNQEGPEAMVNDFLGVEKKFPGFPQKFGSLVETMEKKYLAGSVSGRIPLMNSGGCGHSHEEQGSAHLPHAHGGGSCGHHHEEGQIPKKGSCSHHHDNERATR